MPYTARQAEMLCNESELKLFKSSLPGNVRKLTPARLATAVKRARALRDKWTEQTNSQRRAAQDAKGARGVDAALRSGQKAELFAEVLERLLAQSARVNGASQKSSAATRGTTKGRVGRTGTRDSLKATRDRINTEQRPGRGGGGAVGKKHEPVAAPAVEDIGSASGSDLVEAGPKKSAPTKSLPKRAGKPAARVPAAIAQPHLDAARGGKLGAVPAKRQKIATSGLTSRTRGHVSARGRRSQGKRDSR